MFFGCQCCGAGDFYWLRKYADSSQVNVIAEVDVAKFRNTGDPKKDYPIPRDVTVRDSKVEVISNDSDLSPTIWMRHVYNTDLELTRTDQWSSLAFTHHTNGECLALCTTSSVTVYDDVGAVKYTVSISASDTVERVCLDSSNNLYVSVYQFTGTGFQIFFIIKYNSSGIFQWRLARGAVGTVVDMEPASDDYIWVMRKGAVSSLVLDRVSPSGSFISPTTGAGLAGNSVLLADESNGMWVVHKSSVLIPNVFARRYDSSGTLANGPFYLAMGELLYAFVNDITALWAVPFTFTSQQITKWTASGTSEYTWQTAGYLPGTKYWDTNARPRCGAYSGLNIYLCGYRTQKQ
jgi:hypothetical protein